MYSVMVVDDDPDVLDGLAKIVDWDGLGLQIVAAMPGAAEALSYIQGHPVDILLTDIKMPGMSGLELIAQIRSLGRDVKCIVLSGHDDYQYMHRAIRLGIENYLLKSINEDELTETLENIITKLRHAGRVSFASSDPILHENVLYRWLNGRIADRELRERAQILGIDLACGYQAGILRLDGADPAQAEAVLGDLAEAIRPRPLVMRSYEDDFALLFPDPEDRGPSRPIGELLGELARGMAAKLGCGWFFSLGQRVKSHQRVHYSYRQAQAALGYSTMLNWPCGVDYGACAMENAKEGELPSEHLEKFHALLLYEPEKAMPFLDQLYAQRFDTERFAPDYLKNATLRLGLTAMKAAERSIPDVRELFGEAPLLEDRIARMKTREALHGWIRGVAQRFTVLNPAQGAALSPVVRRVANYVEGHYMESLSLKYLAQALNMNAAYLGRVFKEELGEPFSGYLNRRRIEKAKALLRGTGQSVGEIARRVGYPNANHFINTFRKYEGSLPGEYRKWR